MVVGQLLGPLLILLLLPVLSPVDLIWPVAVLFFAGGLLVFSGRTAGFFICGVKKMIPMPSHLLEMAPIERRLVEQYVNTYCRETGRFDPRLAADDAGPVELHSHIKAWRAAGWRPIWFRLDKPTTSWRARLPTFRPLAITAWRHLPGLEGTVIGNP